MKTRAFLGTVLPQFGQALKLGLRGDLGLGIDGELGSGRGAGSGWRQRVRGGLGGKGADGMRMRVMEVEG